ncbi:cytochrome c oxidase subunit NDUFA4 [Schistocerca americana]|uniref:cytochrome c oxidase subunit NDUFA4 n=1 Tax=Schistocerca americana TaxID=7009 RepID=UPI001F503F2D|nr:cytochrome c oxidase subunit NDUFA4 [Schistocerca americana]XP_047100564.1 cytochrome c oxidase subunit NDUFA4 [Schistocerca piceifrons]XP_049770883.1 cytochrome c oxidase subunit NDUFA4 [Schistocerca cancellata]XP_049797705.1 cytochrome c oxidase subunit NDUFA4 [Schistocerca nitens]XP_049842936.1 cytochrome c oxidase subunit NDUFA4 [Schistocerca gregaria]XP_049946014.1 cytochrome c oxidase subunit NDUFA4 [Schistocerca serialis cubense]
MQGLSFSSLKKNPSLIPLYICLGAGVAGAIFYTLRLATRNPEVTWNKRSNPEPWNDYSNKQYKFYSPVRDYSKIESPAPKYQE